jgi:hypothetical protein
MRLKKSSRSAILLRNSLLAIRKFGSMDRKIITNLLLLPELLVPGMPCSVESPLPRATFFTRNQLNLNHWNISKQKNLPLN